MLKKIKAWLEEKGFVKKIKEKTMSKEDWETVEAHVQEKFGVTLAEATEKAKEEKINESAAEERDSFIEAVFDGQESEKETAAETTAENNEVSEETSPEKKTAKKTTAEAVKEVKKIKAENKKLKAEPETPTPTAKVKSDKIIMLCGPGTTAKHLFGIPNELFSMDKRWNKAAASLSAINDRYDNEVAAEFKEEFNKYAKAFGSRWEQLHAAGHLPTIVAGTFDYTDLASDLGAYYQVRRMDALITFIKKLDSIDKIIPVRYNVQDEEVIVNAFQGKSYSGAFVSGKVSSGAGFGFEPDKAKVKDVMFKYMFDNLKDLEKQYIGYLNKEGSDPIKWGMIEWTLRQCSIIAHNEKEERRVVGVRVEPTTGKMGHYRYGSDGIFTHLANLADGSNPNKKVQVYEFANLKTYTTSTLVDYTRSFVRSVYRMLKGNMNGYVLCMNAIDYPDFKEAYREKYKSDSNFSGEKMEVKDFPLPKIVGIPNMGDLQYMFIMKEDTLEIQENKPGEYYAHYFQRDIEQLWVAAYAKEGVFAFAGKKYDTQTDMQADKGKFTNIFINKPVTVLDADEATPDAAENNQFLTAANTGATEITDFDNAVEGVLYKVEIGSLTNTTTIAKALKFANITAAWAPTALGDYLKVIYDPTKDEFLEYSRKVGGVITVNTNLKAPEYTEA